MEILCLGLSHHTAPVELREKFAIPDGEVGAAAAALRSCAAAAAISPSGIANFSRSSTGAV